jgi:uncharacterized protein (DUF608 family)
MRILGHRLNESTKEVTYEVRWEAEGEDPEDFWFERGELIDHQQDALEKYEREHGLSVYYK